MITVKAKQIPNEKTLLLNTFLHRVRPDSLRMTKQRTDDLGASKRHAMRNLLAPLFLILFPVSSLHFSMQSIYSKLASKARAWK
jgi:hypothetical protein